MKNLGGVGLALVLVCLCIFATQAVNRCLVTHGDAPCKESGALPINLECRYPGQWFQVKKTEVQTPTGHWNPVSMETIADKQCKQTKKASGKNFACEVAKFSNLGRVRQVRITYYCWEFATSTISCRMLLTRDRNLIWLVAKVSYWNDIIDASRVPCCCSMRMLRGLKNPDSLGGFGRKRSGKFPLSMMP